MDSVLAVIAAMRREAYLGKTNEWSIGAWDRHAGSLLRYAEELERALGLVHGGCARRGGGSDEGR